VQKYQFFAKISTDAKKSAFAKIQILQKISSLAKNINFSII
jgi:hypothetical protein